MKKFVLSVDLLSISFSAGANNATILTNWFYGQSETQFCFFVSSCLNYPLQPTLDRKLKNSDKAMWQSTYQHFVESFKI